MREIKFRGKSENNGEWLYGGIEINVQKHFAIIYDERTPYDNEYSVIPESVGQYTGLNDKHGKEIYEGDVVQYHPEANAGVGRVVYEGSGFYVIDEFNGLLDDFATLGIEVIGNITDNPELIEGE